MMRRFRSWRRSRGATLPELLIGSTVFSMILGISLIHLQSTQKSYQSIITRTPVKMRLLLAMHAISRQIREANDLQDHWEFTNQGPGVLLVNYIYNNGIDGRQVYKNYYAQVYNHLDHLNANQDYDGTIPVDIGYRGIVFQKDRRISLDSGKIVNRNFISLDNGSLDQEMKNATLSVFNAGLTKYTQFLLSATPEGDPRKREETVEGTAVLRGYVPYPLPSKGVQPIAVNSQSSPPDAQGCPDQVFALYKIHNYFSDSLKGVRCVEFAYGGHHILSNGDLPVLPEILLTTEDGSTYLDEIVDPTKLPVDISGK